MSVIDKSISTSEVIPSVETDLFRDNPQSRFAVGIVAVGNTVVPSLENEYSAYLLLRGNVYARQKNYMPVEDLNADGTETDQDDARSVHFAVIENTPDGSRAVGSMRLVVKTPEDPSLLPIEHHYPEAFTDGPASMYSTESSRLIGRHEDHKLQRSLKWLLFTAGVSYINKLDLGPAYGAVEPVFTRGLRMEGFPATPISEPKFVEEFNATKQAIRVDLQSLTQKVRNDSPDLLSAMDTLHEGFAYSGTIPDSSADVA